MEVTGWDEKPFKMLHIFMVNERVVAEGTSCGVIVSKSGVIAPEDVMKKVEMSMYIPAIVWILSAGIDNHPMI